MSTRVFLANDIAFLGPQLSSPISTDPQSYMYKSWSVFRQFHHLPSARVAAFSTALELCYTCVFGYSFLYLDISEDHLAQLLKVKILF